MPSIFSADWRNELNAELAGKQPLLGPSSSITIAQATIGFGAYGSYNGAPISSIVPGTTAGALIEGGASGHLVLGIRDNDGADSVSIVAYNGTGAYSRLVASFRASGLIDTFGQIKFPATQQASADPNTLDDYEEGTFTPFYSPSAGAFGSITYDTGNTYGYYTKIGRAALFYGRIRTSAVTVGTASGSLRINGLPFTAPGPAANYAAVYVAFAGGFTANNPSGGLLPASTTIIQPYYRTTANGASASSAVADMNTASTNDIIFGGAYYP